MTSPTPGDIWQWTMGESKYLVMVIEQMDSDHWQCLCFDDGLLDNWWFRKQDMPHWRLIA